jgi:hypothetical protein
MQTAIAAVNTSIRKTIWIVDIDKSAPESSRENTRIKEWILWFTALIRVSFSSGTNCGIVAMTAGF